MKNIILLLLLVSSTLMAEAKIYMGLGYNLYKESYTNKSMESITLSDDAIKLKVGYGVRAAYAVEFSVDYIDHAKYTQTPAIGSAKYGFNVALIKAFDFGIYVNPYLKAGFGAGILNNFGKEEKSLTYGSFDFATGLYIPIKDTYEMEIGYEYKNATYEKEKLDAPTKNTSNINTIYIGINLRF